MQKVMVSWLLSAQSCSESLLQHFDDAVITFISTEMTPGIVVYIECRDQSGLES